MNKIILALTILLGFSPISIAGQNGNGGDGLSLLITDMGHRIHRELLMEPYSKNILQFRDRIPLSEFYRALLQTKVVTTNEIVYDRHGDETTLRHLEPREVAEHWRKEGVNETEISQRLEHYPFGLIRVNRARLNDEMQLGWKVVFKTVFHEYARVMGINEDNYVMSASREADEFFERLSTTGLPARQAAFDSKIDLINIEKARLKKTMAEDARDMDAVLAKRSRAVEERRKAFTEFGNSYAKMLGSMGIVPLPFPTYRENVVRRMTQSLAAGMIFEQKMTEFEVINAQMDFLVINLKINRDFYHKLEKRHQDLILKELE